MTQTAPPDRPSRRRLLTGALLLALFGSEPAFGKTAGKTYTVVFSQDTLANDWRRAQALGFEQAFRRHPQVRFRYTDGRGNSAQQVQDIEDALEQGLDLLIVSARDADLTAPVVEKAKRQGVRVILASRRVSTEAYDTFIHGDNVGIGRQAARRIAQRLGGRGAVLVLQGVPTASTAIERTEGFMKELKRYPGLRVAALKPADYLRDKAIEAVEEVIAQGTHFDAIFSQSDSMAVGARAALKRAGLDPKKIPIVGVDYIQDARAAIRAGEQDASFIYPIFVRECVDAAMRLLAGRPVPRDIAARSVMVTRDNVDKVEPIF